MKGEPCGKHLIPQQEQKSKATAESIKQLESLGPERCGGGEGAESWENGEDRVSPRERLERMTPDGFSGAVPGCLQSHEILASMSGLEL